MAKKIPQRQCIGCRISKDKTELIRIVRTKDQGVVVDKTGRMNGRGAYICNDLQCFQKVRKTRALNRLFHMEVAEEIYDQLERQLNDSR